MATFKLQDFLSRVRSEDLARPNRYEIELVPPAGLSSYGSIARTINLYCESSSLPSQNISTKAHRIYGPAHLRPFSSEFGGEGMQMVFYLDQPMNIKGFFDAWMFSIIDPNTFNVAYQRNYVTNIRIKQLNNKNDETYSVTLIDAFPRSTNLLDLNAASNNTPHKLGVTFSYRYWKPEHALTSRFNNPDLTSLAPDRPLNISRVPANPQATKNAIIPQTTSYPPAQINAPAIITGAANQEVGGGTINALGVSP